MYSKESQSTFDNAAVLIALRLKHLRGVSNVLDVVRERIANASDVDPRRNPQLKIDPSKLSQRVGAPRATVESVMAELRRFNYAHLWARAVCPTDPDDVDSVLIETDSPSEFKEELSHGCRVCGRRHDIDEPPLVETFFALNIGDEKQRFKLSRFLLKPRDLIPRQTSPTTVSSTTSSTKPGWCQRFFRYWARTPRSDNSVVTTTAEQLAANAPSSATPSWGTLMAVLAGLLLVYPAVAWGIVVGVNSWMGAIQAFVATVFLAIGGVLGVWCLLKWLFLISTSRRILALANGVGVYIFLRSQFDFQFRYTEGEPFEVSGGTAATDTTMAYVGGAIIIAAIAGVVVIEVVERKSLRSTSLPTRLGGG